MKCITVLPTPSQQNSDSDAYTDDNSIEEVEATLSNLKDESDNTGQALTEWSHWIICTRQLELLLWIYRLSILHNSSFTFTPPVSNSLSNPAVAHDLTAVVSISITSFGQPPLILRSHRFTFLLVLIYYHHHHNGYQKFMEG